MSLKTENKSGWYHEMVNNKQKLSERRIAFWKYFRVETMLLLYLAVILFGDIAGIIYSTDDEVACYYRITGGLVKNICSAAVGQGRFYFFRNYSAPSVKI